MAAGIVSAPITAFVFGNAGGTVGQSAVIATFQAYGNSMLKAASLQGLVAAPPGQSADRRTGPDPAGRPALRLCAPFPLCAEASGAGGSPPHAEKDVTRMDISPHATDDSPVHRLNPLTKLTFAVTVTVSAFALTMTWWPLLLFCATVLPW